MTGSDVDSELYERYQRALCPDCRHSFLWHHFLDAAHPQGCEVEGCFCDLAPDDESIATSMASTGRSAESDAFAVRRFKLVRDEDVTGMSGTGLVAEGVEFSDGQVVLRWRTEWPTSVVFHDRGAASVERLHGHGGRTHIEWVDS